jgi:hypothetical protein
MATDAQRGLRQQREPELAGLATFTLDARGLVTGWPASATRLFGLLGRVAVGQHLCEVLLTGPGQDELADRALAEVRAGRVWATTVAGGRLGDGRFAIRCEPLPGPGGAMMTVWKVWPPPRSGWLAEAASRIGRTLDLDQTASEILDIAVPAFADAAALYVAEHLLAAGETAISRPGQGTAARRLAGRLAHHDLAAADRLMPAGEVVIFDPGTPGAQAMTTGEAVLSGQLDGQAAERIARRPGGAEAAARFTSFLAMPLAARGMVIGCLQFGRTTASPPFSPGEFPHAGELASRAAVCLDNARLYHREHRIALALQHGLLPAQPAAPPGLEVARHYQPVGDSIVGGDWHDIIPLSAGRAAALIVGDAMGHGPEAAAAMVQLRTAAYTLASLDLPPAQVLARLDEMMRAITTAPFATCIAAVIDLPGSSCVISQAGHLPPVLAVPGRPARLLDLPPGLPLGLGAGTFAETRISLPPGATLAVYTDGLVETRARPLDDGLAQLRDALPAALAPPHASLHAACHAITQRLCQHAEDDITLVLTRIR